MFQTKVVEKIQTLILSVITFFKDRAAYVIVWKNIVEPDKPQMTVWPMRIACSIPKATNTHSKYVMFIVFPLQQ
jgi:hypothetical protein